VCRQLRQRQPKLCKALCLSGYSRNPRTWSQVNWIDLSTSAAKAAQCVAFHQQHWCESEVISLAFICSQASQAVLKSPKVLLDLRLFGLGIESR